MSDRERLIELINEAQLQCNDNYGMTNSEQMADYLLLNGVIVSPVKIGDTVYHLFSKQGIVPRRVKRIQLGSYGLMLVDKNGPFSINEIGKTIFLTYEEAEKALKKHEQKNKTLQFVAEEISENYNLDISEAESIVSNSFFPKILEEMPDYVQHYTAEYWTEEIMKDKDKECE